MASESSDTLANDVLRLEVRHAGNQIQVCLHDLAAGFDFADGPYVYRAVRACAEGKIVSESLRDPAVAASTTEIRITGALAGLDVEHVFRLAADQPYIEEQITLHNRTTETITLTDFACGCLRLITDHLGRILPTLADDRLVAVPLRHKATDATAWDNDFGMAHFLTQAGREPRADDKQGFGYMPSEKRISEGWAWMHGAQGLGIFKFNQAALEFSILATEVRRWGVAPQAEGLALRFGGVSMLAGGPGGEPAALACIAPGQSVTLGVTRYQAVRGDFTQVYYAFRAFLDEQGCHWPAGYNPPVQWNELYDNPEWHLVQAAPRTGPKKTRPLAYTKARIMQEAAKARAYSCEALYLDPGWDLDIGTFLWGEEWLGNRRQFVEELREQYGLTLALHTPLATWLSLDGQGVATYPRASFQMDSEGRVIEGAVCLGSQQYLDEAARRLLDNCADGAVFLMYDGNWWNGGCWNPDHGHPIPYTIEDHCRANLDLACRIHAQFPNVLIEMHDMVAGGSYARCTPIYYKYGLPGSFDENWNFELMWRSMDDIRRGFARSQYYYALGCNIPMYLHVDLRDDNQHCLVLWWYASTCRHLGIGGTHEDPLVAQAQKLAMQRYRQLERFYKRGDFYGLGEEIHIHALPDEAAFVVNLFNLSDEPRTIAGTIALSQMGLARERWYITPKGGRFNPTDGTFTISRLLPPWGAQVVEVYTIPEPRV
ncbi:MAG: hypothetical protein U0350_33860 [Caldilineaceae bacterium]